MVQLGEIGWEVLLKPKNGDGEWANELLWFMCKTAHNSGSVDRMAGVGEQEAKSEWARLFVDLHRDAGGKGRNWRVIAEPKGVAPLHKSDTAAWTDAAFELHLN